MIMLHTLVHLETWMGNAVSPVSYGQSAVVWGGHMFFIPQFCHVN